MTSETPNGLSGGKVDELYSLAKTAYANAERRFDDADTKTSRYMSVLFVILGVLTISVDRYRLIAKIESIENYLFSLFAALFYASAITAMVYLIRALRIQKVTTLKVDDSLSQYFERFSRDAAIYGLAKAYLSAANKFQDRTKDKLELAKKGFGLMLISMALGVLAAIAYLFVDFPQPGQ